MHVQINPWRHLVTSGYFLRTNELLSQELAALYLLARKVLVYSNLNLLFFSMYYCYIYLEIIIFIYSQTLISIGHQVKN